MEKIVDVMVRKMEISKTKNKIIIMKTNFLCLWIIEFDVFYLFIYFVSAEK